MSYSFDLSDLRRDGPVSLSHQITDRIVSAIERGDLQPGARLPSTRALAAEAEVNHLTAVRVFQRLAATGYVTSRPRSGTFVRRMAPPSATTDSEDWQLAALPPRPPVATGFLDTVRRARRADVIPLAVGWPDPQLVPTKQLAALAHEVLADAADEATEYGEPEGAWSLRVALADRGRLLGFATDAELDV